MLEWFKSYEVLIVRILLNLFNQITIRESHPLLYDERTKNHPTGFCYTAFDSWKQGSIWWFPDFPGQPVGIFYPFVLTIQLHPARCIELEKAQLQVFGFCGFVHGFRPQVQASKPINSSNWHKAPCTLVAENRPLSLCFQHLPVCWADTK